MNDGVADGATFEELINNWMRLTTAVVTKCYCTRGPN